MRFCYSKLNFILFIIANNGKNVDQENLYDPSSTDNFPYYDDGPPRKDEESSKSYAGQMILVYYIEKLEMWSFALLKLDLTL